MRTALILLSLCAVTAVAEEAQVTLQSTVTGSREQPRVLYIVPWQPPDAVKLNYTLDNRIGEELFAPLDRDEFLREMRYRKKLDQHAGNLLPGESDHQTVEHLQ